MTRARSEADVTTVLAPPSRRASEAPTAFRPRRPGVAPGRAVGAAGWTAYALVLAASVLWGLSGVVTKGVLDAGVGAFEVAFWRLLLGGGLFLLHAGCRNELKLGSRSDLGAFVAFALLAIALHYVAFDYAIERGGISLVNLFLAGVPVLVALAAWVFLRERLTSWTVALGVLSALGLMLVASGGGRGVEVTAVSVGLAVIVALTDAGYTVVGKNLLRRYSPATLNAFVMPLAALLLLPFVDFAPKTPGTWLLLGALAVFPTYAAHLCYQTGLKRIDASRVALLSNVEVITALGTAALLAGERFTAPGALGVALILTVSVLVALPRAPSLRVRGRRPDASRSAAPACTNACPTRPPGLTGP